MQANLTSHGNVGPMPRLVAGASSDCNQSGVYTFIPFLSQRSSQMPKHVRNLSSNIRPEDGKLAGQVERWRLQVLWRMISRLNGQYCESQPYEVSNHFFYTETSHDIQAQGVLESCCTVLKSSSRVVAGYSVPADS